MPEIRFDRGVRTLPLGGDSEVEVACLRAGLRYKGARAGGGFGLGISAPLAVRRRAAPPQPVPWIALGPGGLAAAMICGGAAAPLGEESDMDDPGRIGAVVGEAARPVEMVKALSTAASGQGVVGPATTAGERTVVPLIETLFAGGYGGGGGSAGEKDDLGGGGGGGGFGRSRTVAVLEVAPDGVRIRPVFDQTAVILAGIGAAVGVLGALRRVRRRR